MINTNYSKLMKNMMIFNFLLLRMSAAIKIHDASIARTG